MTPEDRMCKLLCQIDLDASKSGLILQAITEAIKAERKTCAEVARDHDALHIAAAIQAREKT